MPGASWKDLDARRTGLSRPMSRAEMARLAGVSESTITKGIKGDKRPYKAQRQRVELVLAAHEAATDAGVEASS